IPEGHPVVVFGHKEKLFPAAALALMRAQIPFVPFDSRLPNARLVRIRRHLGSQAVINTSGSSLGFFPLEITSEFKIEKREHPDFAARYWFPDDPILYIIFT